MIIGVFAKLQGSSVFFFEFTKLFSYYKIDGIGPRSHGRGPWQFMGLVHGFITPEPPKARSTMKIISTKGYPLIIKRTAATTSSPSPSMKQGDGNSSMVGS
jgi:hypothetical protein